MWTEKPFVSVESKTHSLSFFTFPVLFFVLFLFSRKIISVSGAYLIKNGKYYLRKCKLTMEVHYCSLPMDCSLIYLIFLFNRFHFFSNKSEIIFFYFFFFLLLVLFFVSKRGKRNAKVVRSAILHRYDERITLDVVHRKIKSIK